MGNMERSERESQLLDEERVRKFCDCRERAVADFQAFLTCEFQTGRPGKRLVLEVIIEPDGFVKVADVTVRPRPLGERR